MNKELRDKLLGLKNKDQETRQRLLESGELFNSYHSKMEKVHRDNTKGLKEIIDEHGWPPSSLVGKDGVEAAWLVLQHSTFDPEFMKRMVPVLKKQYEEGEIEGQYYALLLDRVLIYSGEKQVYGTQFDWDENGEMSPVNLESQEKVNEKRAELGMSTIEENIKLIRDINKKEGAEPPADLDDYRKKVNEFYKSHGWR